MESNKKDKFDVLLVYGAVYNGPNRVGRSDRLRVGS